SVVIPMKVGEKYVTGIADYAFEDCASLVSVQLPDFDDEAYLNGYEFDFLGEYAFSGCVSLTEIELPERISFISRGAFRGCAALTRASFPDGAYVASYAFSNCTALREISTLRNAGEGTFSHCVSLPSLPLSTPITEIEEDCFEHCDSLIHVTIPASVKYIGSLAFRGCKRLEKVTFENPNGWYAHCVYNSKNAPLDLSDPEKNAKLLVGMDFDDGIGGWYRDT
ncbi:MAG: leucine-rich repeat domain-containing protein, partial [Clostridia bacterium]|nr:leucine-rich repeat domain-containing protein [Clostridia bacterium]